MNSGPTHRWRIHRQQCLPRKLNQPLTAGFSDSSLSTLWEEVKGSRLTAWEMVKEGVLVTLMTENMARFLVSKVEIDVVVVATDRVATNGKIANKIGAYVAAMLDRRCDFLFCVAWPLSTIDLNIDYISAILIEERDAEEVISFRDCKLAAQGVMVRNPAFDVKPAELVTGLIIEKGVVHKPNREKLEALFL